MNNNFQVSILPVLDVYLDTKNPRHDLIEDQDGIIEYLVSNEKIKSLAKDIVDNRLSPIELFAVLEDDSGRHVVLEGNRRLCALILLIDPEKSPSFARSYFQKLAKNMKSPVTEIPSVVFNSREEADIWIDRRHEGEQDGIGTKQWDATQKTRRNLSRQKKDPNALAQALLEYAVKRGYITQDQTKKILTTATRYLGTPFFRETMGIDSKRNDPNVVIKVSCDDFDKILEKFCKDLVDEQSMVSSRSSKTEREDYAKRLIEEGFAPRVSSKKTRLSDRSPSSGNPNKPSSPDKRNPDPDRRKHIIPSSGFSVSIKDNNLRRALRELKKMPVKDFPLAVALVSRAFLERLYCLFYEKKAGRSIGHKLKTHEILKKVIELIEQDKSLPSSERNALGALRRVQANDNNVLSPKTLGANAHLGIYPNAPELNKEWDNIQAVLSYMLKRL